MQVFYFGVYMVLDFYDAVSRLEQQITSFSLCCLTGLGPLR